MNIVLIGMTKIKYMPYVDFYISEIDNYKNNVSLVYWDRDGKSDSNINNSIKLNCFRDNINDSSRLISKISHFLKYRIYIINAIKKIKPDFIIVFYQTAGLLLLDILIRKYNKKYIIDFRDITYEKYAIYKYLVKKLLNNAYCTFCSSDGFRSYLPNLLNIYTSHNVSLKCNFDKEKYMDISCQNRIPIRISFWGLIRHLDINKAIIEKLGNDNRFELHYYGVADARMLNMLNSAKKKYNNIYFHNDYNPIDKDNFALKTDIIHNMYSNIDNTMPLAISNKYYDGLMYYKPQLCMKGSYMAKKVEKAGIGLPCDPNSKEFVDNIYSYYMSIDKKKFIKNCDIELGCIMNDVNLGKKVIEKVMNIDNR